MHQKLIETVKQFGSTPLHALVIGDVMLDRYLICLLYTSFCVICTTTFFDALEAL